MTIQGQYRVNKVRKGKTITGEWQDNLIMIDNNAGWNLVFRQLAGTITNLLIDELKIGTGTTAPTETDTDIETEAVAGIPVATVDATTNPDEVVWVFFIPDRDLPEDEYTEIALFSAGRIFSRILLSPTYEKESGDDTMIEYKITASNPT